MAAKTAVWRAERKCFSLGISARAINTLKTFAYETQVFLVYAENIGMDKAILRIGWFIFALEFAKCVKHFLPPVILLCAVTELNTRLVRVLSGGTWQIPKLSAPFFCIH